MLKELSLKNTFTTVYVVFLIIIAGFIIGSAAQYNLLIQVALPFAITLVLGLRFLSPKAELIAWAAFTVWLGSTYLQTGSFIEVVAFFFYAVFAAMGIFISPYYLAIGWLLHPIWDFVPRQLPNMLLDLPTACILFDIPIGLYVLVGAWKKRWTVFNQNLEQPSTKIHSKQAIKQTATAIYILILLVALSYIPSVLINLNVLTWASVPLSIVLILALRLIGSRAELIAWAVFTGWIGMTYAHTGGLIEALAFFVYVALSGLGVFSSSYFLATAWLIFIPWNFLPHELPSVYKDLPLACILFSIPIVIYLLWGARSRQWNAFGKAETTDPSNNPLPQLSQQKAILGGNNA